MLTLLLAGCALDDPKPGTPPGDTGESGSADMDTGATETATETATDSGTGPDTGSDSGYTGVEVPLQGARILCELSSTNCWWRGAGAYAAEDGEELAFFEYDTLHLARAPDAGEATLAELAVGSVPLEAKTETSSIYPTVLADLDGDGWDDVVERRIDSLSLDAEFARLTFTLYAHLGPLAAGPASSWTLSLDALETSGSDESFFVADLDGDGDREVVYASASQAAYSGDEAAWRVAADGSASPLYGPTDTTHGELGTIIAGGDLDGDGLTDLARMGATSPGALLVHHGPITAIPDAADADATVTSTDVALALALGDVDGDGLDDLALGGNTRSNSLWLLAGPTADGALVDLASAQLLPENDVFYWDDILGGDVDADGTWNLVVGDPWWDDAGDGEPEGAVYVFDRAPRGAVSLADADRRIRGTVSGAPIVPTGVLADGRILAVAEDEPTAGGEGVAYLIEP